MPIQSINPATGEVLKSFTEISDTELEAKLTQAHEAYLQWRETTPAERREKMLALARIYTANAPELGKIATLEMGKLHSQAIAEIEKCAWLMEYYAEEAEKHLSPQLVETEAHKSYVRFDPLGVVLAVMPWNFPYWQVVRAFVPNLMAGNTVVLKHASNVPQVALKMEEMFAEAGFPGGVFSTLLIGSSKVEAVINDSRIAGVTLTGSEYAGGQVAAAAGKQIKKTVLELGGSDPFIVYPDVNVDDVVAQAVTARLQNNGQSCIAAKRFLVHEDIYAEFETKLKKAYEALVVGDPMDKNTNVGPVVNQDSLNELERQISEAVAAGGKLITGGIDKAGKGFYCKPTIIANISQDSPLYREETFGPVASLYSFATDTEMLEIANATEFGLGASIWTADIAHAEELAAKIEAGSVFINKLVASHPKLPFGGIKKSGYGRELSEFGIREFVNIKTVYVK